MTKEREWPWDKRPIKKVTTKQIEDAIAKAVTELTGQPYEATIHSINFEPNGFNSAMNDEVELSLKISKPSGSFGESNEEK